MSDDIPSLAEALAEIRQSPSILTINHITRKALEILAMSEAEFNRRNEMELEAEIARLEAEIARLRAHVAKLEQTIEYVNQANDAFQARNVQLEAAAATAPKHSLPDAASIKMFATAVAAMRAMQLGTMEPPVDDEPARYTHNVPPSAPPHDE